MTLLLVMEAIDAGQLSLEDKVQVSEYAASMGGSQVYLEPGEEMKCEDLLKSVISRLREPMRRSLLRSACRAACRHLLSA